MIYCEMISIGSILHDHQCVEEEVFYINSHKFDVWSFQYAVEEQLRCNNVIGGTSSFTILID